MQFEFCCREMVVALVVFLVTLAPDRAGGQSEDVALRFPVAVNFLSDSKTILSANQRGTVSLVSIADKNVAAEYELGVQLSDACALGNDVFVVSDFKAHRLLAIEINPQTYDLKVLWKIEVAKYPQQIVYAAKQNRLFVASLWSHRLSIIDLDSPEPKSESVDLSFAPGAIAWDSTRNLLFVAAAFTNRVAVLERKQNDDEWAVALERVFEGMSIRRIRLSLDGKRLVMSCQILNELASTSRNDIHWGLMMSNEVREYDVDSMLEQNRKTIRASSIFPLGRDENGKGDPGSILMVPNQDTSRGESEKASSWIFAVEATNEIAIRNSDETGFEYLKVGIHPRDLALSQDGSMVAVANRLDDTISILRLERSKSELNIAPDQTVSLGRRPQLNSVQAGEVHFFSGSASHDRWISCNSCHTRGHTNGLLNDNKSDQSFGTPKLVISALGRRDTKPFAWNGSSQDLGEQIEKSILNTMQYGSEPEASTVSQLASFLESLPPPPSLLAARNLEEEQDFAKSITSGKRLFQSLDCKECHSGPKYTSTDSKDVGLSDERGHSLFNPPSLLGVSQRPALLHDGRVKTLDDLFNRLKHQLPRELSESELNDLVQFLKSL